MKKNFKPAPKDYTGDDVIKRGYAIYDEWNDKHLSSREIVAYVERAVSAMKQNKKKTASIDALACLFALDTRIKEKYSTLWRCLLFYFSWRRETRALKLLRGAFHLSDAKEDIRQSIEVALQKLRERLKTDKAEDGDDETRGGKRNGKPNEEAVAEQGKQQEQAEEKSAEALSDKSEAKEQSEESEETLDEQSPTEEQQAEAEEQQKNEETPQAESNTKEQNDKEQVEQEAYNEQKENSKEQKDENNVSDEPSETSADKAKATYDYYNNPYNQYYSNTTDQPWFFELTESSQQTSQASADEVVEDHTSKARNDDLRNPFLKDAKQDRNDNPNRENTQKQDDKREKPSQQNGETKQNDRNSRLQDKMNNNPNKGNPTREPEKSPVTKTEQLQTPTQKDENMDAIKHDFESVRVPIQVDMSLDQENQMRRELSFNMTAEQVQAFHDRLMEDAREQMKITSAELGIEGPVERPVPLQPKTSGVGLNRK